MSLAFIQELFSGRAATAICWTLIHSLWQGLFFALITGMIILGTKKSTPAFRYKIISIQFLFLIPVFLFTFIWQWNIANNAENFQYFIKGIAANDATGTTLMSSRSVQFQFFDSISAFLSDNVSTIVGAWFLVFLMKSIKVVSSLVYTQHLRTYKTHQPSQYWNNKIDDICKRLGITKTIRLLESEIIKVPAVFGHLKPVIFIPLGMLSALPAEQIEAVLCHELAHIRRSDYLFNLLQNIIETIFFFNPAVLWISSLLREERENCCDDIAIAQTNDKKQFVESLIRFREMYLYNQSKYVTAFPGTKNSFVNRITRIAMNKNKSLNPAENVFLALSLIIISTLVMAFTQVKDPAEQKVAPVNNIVKPTVNTPPVETIVTATPAKAPLTAVHDTVPVTKKNAQQVETIKSLDNGNYSVIYSDIDKSAGKETVVLKADGNEYKIVKLNGVLSYLMVNDEKIPQERMGEYSDLLKRITDQLERMRKEQEIRDKEQEKRNAEQAIRNQEQEKRNAEQAIRNQEQEKRNEEQIARNKEQEIRDAEQKTRDREQEQRNAEQEVRNKEQEQRNREQEIRNKEQEVRNAELQKMLDDLMSDKIITSRKVLSFTLTDDEFIVNGVKQSPEVFKKYKTKYSKLVGGTFNYRSN